MKKGNAAKLKNSLAQVSLEHMLMVAIGLFTIIPVVFLFYTYSQDSLDDLSITQARNIGTKIVNNAESIYYLGSPSKVTLQENMPDGIANMTILKDLPNNAYELVFYYGNNQTIVFSSNVPIDGNFDEASFSQGTKNILIESLDTYVNISIT